MRDIVEMALKAGVKIAGGVLIDNGDKRRLAATASTDGEILYFGKCSIRETGDRFPKEGYAALTQSNLHIDAWTRQTSKKIRISAARSDLALVSRRGRMGYLLEMDFFSFRTGGKTYEAIFENAPKLLELLSL